MTTNTPEPQADTKALTVIVDRSRNLAESVIRDPSRAENLADAAQRKAERNPGPLRKVWTYLTALFRLLKAYTRREYTSVPWGSIVLVTVALLYFVSPLDLIPDIVPGGLVDDVALIAFVIRQIQSDLDAYLAWEARQGEDKTD